jgi:hypothetical protein
MPALAFLAVVGLALVALLLVADATLKPVIVTSQRSGPPKPWHPGAIQTLTTAPALKATGVFCGLPRELCNTMLSISRSSENSKL